MMYPKVRLVRGRDLPASAGRLTSYVDAEPDTEGSENEPDDSPDEVASSTVGPIFMPVGEEQHVHVVGSVAFSIGSGSGAAIALTVYITELRTTSSTTQQALPEFAPLGTTPTGLGASRSKPGPAYLSRWPPVLINNTRTWIAEAGAVGPEHGASGVLAGDRSSAPPLK